MMKYLRVFWPVLLYMIMFAAVYWSARDFYSGNSVGVWEYLYIPGLVACGFILPAIALIQGVYGLFVFFRSKDRSALIHLLSPVAIAILTAVFFMVADNHLVITI